MYTMTNDGKIWYTEQITPTISLNYEMCPVYLSKEDEVWYDSTSRSTIHATDIVFMTSSKDVIKKLLLESPDLIKDKDMVEIDDDADEFNEHIVNDELVKNYFNSIHNDPDYYI